MHSDLPKSDFTKNENLQFADIKFVADKVLNHNLPNYLLILSFRQIAQKVTICQKRHNNAGLSAGESLRARYRSQTFARLFTSVLLVIAHCLNDIMTHRNLANCHSTFLI